MDGLTDSEACKPSIDFMNMGLNSGKILQDLVTCVALFPGCSQCSEVRGACPTSCGFMACWATIQAGFADRKGMERSLFSSSTWWLILIISGLSLLIPLKKPPTWDSYLATK